MAIVPFPRRVLRSLSWRQEQARPTLQRSAFTGRTRAIVLQSAARWIAEGEVVPADPALRAILSAFEALAIPPDATFRLPATEAGQVASPNLIQNPDLRTGTQSWVLPVSVSRFLADWTAPMDFYFNCDAGSLRSILANGDLNVAAAASTRYFAESWSFRSSGSVLVKLALEWRNASNTVISTDFLDLSTTAGQWDKAAASFVSPAGTAFVRIRYQVEAFGSGFAAVGLPRVSLIPTFCRVNGAGQSGASLNLKNLAAGLVNLSPGQFLTIRLPGGDEQMVQALNTVVADGSGNGAVQFATPLRASPADEALVEIDRPWALMRAVHEPGWSVSPGPLYRHAFQAEEAF